MKNKLKIRILLLLGTLCVIQNQLFAPSKKKTIVINKNKKNENLDEIFKNFEKKTKEIEQKNKKTSQRSLFENLKKEFAKNNNDTTLTFESCCSIIKNLLEQQKKSLKLSIEVSSFLFDEEQVTNSWVSTWGKYMEFSYLQNKTGRIFTINNNYKTDEANILFLRYMDIIKNCKYPEKCKFNLTTEDIAFLQNNTNTNNEEVSIISAGILKTNDYIHYKKEKIKYLTDDSNVRNDLKKKIQQLSLSEKLNLELFNPILTVTEGRKELLNNYKQSESFLYYNNLHQLHKNLLLKSENILNLFKNSDMDKTSNKKENKNSPKETVNITHSELEIQKNKELENELKNTDKNNEITYFKTKSFSNIPFNFFDALPRVTDWMNNPEQVYKEHIKIYNKKSNAQDYNLMIKYHSFSYAVDLFIESLAIQCDWIAEGSREGDISYNIPGKIIYTIKDKDEQIKNITVTGVFSYGVTKDGILFHRCFSEQSYQYIQKQFEERREYAEYPASNFEITTSNKEIKKQLKLKPIIFDDYQEDIKENSFYIEIKDEKNDMIIQLFKTK